MQWSEQTSSSNNTREDSTHGPHQMVNTEIRVICSQRWRSSIQSAKTRPGADCGSDHELLITKFRLKLKKAGKTARPFRYDLNQICYNYTVELTNRFNGLDLTERVPWRTRDTVLWHCIGGNDQDHPQEKEKQKASGEALQIAEKRKDAKAKGKRKDTPIWVQRPKE